MYVLWLDLLLQRIISLRLSVILLQVKQTKGQKIDETTSIARAILSLTNNRLQCCDTLCFCDDISTLYTL